MRHDGLRRINKPFPNAADSHMPLIDMAIADLKPFWLAQAFGGERLCDFLSLKDQLGSMTEAAADFLSFELLHRTSYRYVMEQVVDTMLLRGRGVLKTVFDPFTQKIIKRCVDPLFIIMPEQSDDFEDADWFVEIQHLTVPQYQRNRNFDQRALPSIRGKTDWNLSAIKLDKQVREGVTHSSREDIIVLWNYYERTPGGYTVFTHCPLAWDQHVRDPYGLNLDWDGEKLLPFKSFTMEIKDEGWYSPRGIAELNAAFEAYATKLWNEKSDAMTFGNRPLFTGDNNDIPNGANLRFMPGEYIPGNVKAVQMPPPAFSFAEEINFTRGMAEQRAKMPDYGIVAPGDNSTGGKPRTATENQRIASLQDVGADHNGDIFRMRLERQYRLDWAIICHREELAKQAGRPGGRLAYFVADNLKVLPPQALHDQYLVVPAGGSGTKAQRIQRALSRMQVFRGAPNIDQDELAKEVIAADDSRLVNKLLIPSAQKAQDEAFLEDLELIVMSQGRPVPVLAGQDHATRIQEIIGFLHKQQTTGAPVDPMAKNVIGQHLAQHFQYLKQQQPQVAKQMLAAVAQLEQASAGPAQPQSPPPNGNGNGQPVPVANGAAQRNGSSSPTRESVSVNYRDLPEDVKRQAEAAAGFVPSRLPPPAPMPPGAAPPRF